MNNEIKHCEVCGIEIPSDYQNNLCLNCYDKEVKDTERKREEEKEEQKVSGQPTAEEIHAEGGKEHVPIKGITDPDYKTNPQQDEINLVQRNYAQFEKTGKWLWGATRDMYSFIMSTFRDIVVNHPQYPKFVWKPTVCDIGCGSGVGSNILSQEADFLWGIDKNPTNVNFCKELFTRQKNGIYYTPEIRFDVVDIENPQPNIDMKFDVITCIEVWEHLEDDSKLFDFIKSICHPSIKSRKTGQEAVPPTLVWLSTPNRNNKGISDEKPKNKYHVKEYNSAEAISILKEHFEDVWVFNSAGQQIPEEEYLTTTHTPLLFCCRNVK